MLGKGVGVAFTAVAPKYVGTTLVLWLELEAGQRGLFSLAVRRTALLEGRRGGFHFYRFQFTFEFLLSAMLHVGEVTSFRLFRATGARVCYSSDILSGVL